MPPDEQHPLGYGRELYFWCFVVALLIFSLGAGISVYEGVTHILHPAPIENPHVNYIVLGLSFVFEAITWCIALREFEKQRGSLRYLEAATRSRDPASYLVLFEDSAAPVGLLIAFAGTFAAEVSGIKELDGLASIGIGLVLTVTALFLARESKSLLIGEPAREPTRRSIRTIALGTPGVSSIGRLSTVHLAPQQIVAAFDIDFADDLRASEIERATASIERSLKAKHPPKSSMAANPGPASSA